MAPVPPTELDLAVRSVEHYGPVAGALTKYEEAHKKLLTAELDLLGKQFEYKEPGGFTARMMKQRGEKTVYEERFAALPADKQKLLTDLRAAESAADSELQKVAGEAVANTRVLDVSKLPVPERTIAFAERIRGNAGELTQEEEAARVDSTNRHIVYEEVLQRAKRRALTEITYNDRLQVAELRKNNTAEFEDLEKSGKTLDKALEEARAKDAAELKKYKEDLAAGRVQNPVEDPESEFTKNTGAVLEGNTAKDFLKKKDALLEKAKKQLIEGVFKNDPMKEQKADRVITLLDSNLRRDSAGYGALHEHQMKNAQHEGFRQGFEQGQKDAVELLNKQQQQQQKPPAPPADGPMASALRSANDPNYQPAVPAGYHQPATSGSTAPDTELALSA